MAASPLPLIQPFWTRVPRFFVFPLTPAALWRVLLLAALPALGAFATSPPAIAVVVAGLALLAWVFLLRFGSRVLSEASLGRLSPAEYSPLPDDTLAHMPYKIFALMFVTGILVGVVRSTFGEEAAMAANFALMLLLPAALMALVVSRSLATGLSPAASWDLISRIGKPYALLCVFLFCLSQGQMLLIGKVVEHRILPLIQVWGELQGQLRTAIEAQNEETFRQTAQALQAFFTGMRPTLAGAIWLCNGVAMYFTLIAFSLLGYVLYQFHEALGLEVAVLPGQRHAAQPKPGEDEESQRITAFLAAGQTDQALEVAYEAQRLDPDNTTAQERYSRLLHLTGKDARLLNHTQRLIPLLLRKEQPRNALEAWKRCRDKHPEFRPEDAGCVLQLAAAARANREPRLALEILNGFDKAFRHSPLLAEVYFLGGQILCEDLHQDALAERFFVTLANRFPDHPRVEEAQRLRAAIARLRQHAEQASPAG